MENDFALIQFLAITFNGSFYAILVLSFGSSDFSSTSYVCEEVISERELLVSQWLKTLP